MDLLLTGDDDEDDDASRVNTPSLTIYLNSLSPLNYQKYAGPGRKPTLPKTSDWRSDQNGRSMSVLDWFGRSSVRVTKKKKGSNTNAGYHLNGRQGSTFNKGYHAHGNMKDRKHMSNFERVMKNKVVSFFFTNFPDNLDSNVLWRMFEKYGNVVDVYISFKRTKRDTGFGFVRFINTCDIEAFERRLKGTMIGDVRIVIDRAKFIKGENKSVPPSHFSPVNPTTPTRAAPPKSFGNSVDNYENDDDFEEEFIGPSMEDLSDGDFFGVRNMNGLEDDELALIHSPRQVLKPRTLTTWKMSFALMTLLQHNNLQSLYNHLLSYRTKLDSIIPLGQKNTLAEYMLLFDADNRPPMLDKDLYDSWKSRMELYMKNREHERMILESVENGPLIWHTIKENMVTKIKKYAELSTVEKIQADCDIKATNIILQGLPSDIYSLVNHHRVAKQFQVSTKFLNSLPPEWSKFVTDVKLVKDLHTTNFDQLHAYLEQHELHANEVRLLRERNQDPFAFFRPSQYGSIHPTQHYSSTYPSQPQIIYSSVPPSYPYQSQMNHQTSYVLQIAYQSSQVSTQPMTKSPLVDSGFTILVFSPGDDPIACLNKFWDTIQVDIWLGNALNLSDQKMQHGVPDGQALQTIIPNNADFQTDDLDTYDSNCDDISNAKAILMANISNYGSDVILEVPHFETYLNDMENQRIVEQAKAKQPLDNALDFSCSLDFSLVFVFASSVILIVCLMGDRRSFNSKEDLTLKISKLVFVMNFPDHVTARDLWNVCSTYGQVVDVFIPLKKSKAGKFFSFVRFLKVDNLDRLIDNMCTIWIGRFHLHANQVRFQRATRSSSFKSTNANVGSAKNSFAFVLKSSNQSPILATETYPAIILDDSCIMDKDMSYSLMGNVKDLIKVKVIVKGQVYWLHVKKLDAWAPDFSNDSNDFSSSDEDYEDNEVGCSGGKQGSACNFDDEEGEFVKDTEMDHVSESCCLGQSAKKRWTHELNRKHKVNFVSVQETKIENINLFSINSLWGNVSYDYAFSPFVGYSGGILCVWDSNMFVKESMTISDSFVAIRGTWISTSTKLLIISVYAPQEASERRILWDYFRIMIESWEGFSIFIVNTFVSLGCSGKFSRKKRRTLWEHFYADHMNAILGVYTELDEVTNLQCDPILGYGDLVQGAVTIKRVYYVEGLNH
nr:RNA-directed DNA polymerase, eukaryota, nucleotide-binding alpha-beta plait domain protein [Tanacetum cinerariifolium]